MINLLVKIQEENEVSQAFCWWGRNGELSIQGLMENERKCNVRASEGIMQL